MTTSISRLQQSLAGGVSSTLVLKALQVEKASRVNLNGDKLATLAVLEHSCWSSLYLALFLVTASSTVVSKGTIEFHRVDGGLVLAPDDHVWSAVTTGEGGWETVGLVGDVHYDLLL